MQRPQRCNDQEHPASKSPGRQGNPRQQGPTQLRFSLPDRGAATGVDMVPQVIQLNRRQFLNGATVAAAFFATHGFGEAEEQKTQAPSANAGKDEPRIRRLELASSAPLADLKKFYHRLLGLRVVEEKPERLTINAGRTRITFVPATGDAKPFYHFAFNIPENKIVAAHQWQKKRTPLLPIPKTLRDPKYPDDVVDYRHWDAHSIFFFDPAGNVVEFIARHDLKNAVRGEFSSADILYASEIAFVVDDVAATAAKLKEVAGVKSYKGASDQFAAVGDEHGLLLVMKRGRVISFASPQKKAVSVFRTSVAVRGSRRTRYVWPRFPYDIAVES
jgi:catechol-2,3-dioxygenase